jgi:hypothetical protein
MGEMVLSYSVNSVVKILCDSKAIGNWMSGIKRSYCLKQVSGSECMVIPCSIFHGLSRNVI